MQKYQYKAPVVVLIYELDLKKAKELLEIR
jgi:hypothetical protein